MAGAASSPARTQPVSEPPCPGSRQTIFPAKRASGVEVAVGVSVAVGGSGVGVTVGVRVGVDVRTKAVGVAGITSSPGVSMLTGTVGDAPCPVDAQTRSMLNEITNTQTIRTPPILSQLAPPRFLRLFGGRGGGVAPGFASASGTVRPFAPAPDGLRSQSAESGL